MSETSADFGCLLQALKRYTDDSSGDSAPLPESFGVESILALARAHGVELAVAHSLAASSEAAGKAALQGVARQ